MYLILYQYSVISWPTLVLFVLGNTMRRRVRKTEKEQERQELFRHHKMTLYCSTVHQTANGRTDPRGGRLAPLRRLSPPYSRVQPIHLYVPTTIVHTLGTFAGTRDNRTVYLSSVRTVDDGTIYLPLSLPCIYTLWSFRRAVDFCPCFYRTHARSGRSYRLAKCIGVFAINRRIPLHRDELTAYIYIPRVYHISIHEYRYIHCIHT